MSTVIDDWGEQAFFSGMPLGSLGPDYVFNGGRSSFRHESGADLIIVENNGHRGLRLGDDDPVMLEIFCPSLVLSFRLFNGDDRTVTIEKGRRLDSGAATDWSTSPLYEEHFVFTRSKYYSHTSLQTWSRFRISGLPSVCILQECMTIDCSECANLPVC